MYTYSITHMTYYTSHITHHTSHITHHTSHIIHHTSHSYQSTIQSFHVARHHRHVTFFHLTPKIFRFHQTQLSKHHPCDLGEQRALVAKRRPTAEPFGHQSLRRRGGGGCGYIRKYLKLRFGSKLITQFVIIIISWKFQQKTDHHHHT